ncbi:CLUMA_CG016002, isoform A [Clunio marinus]|uniref:Odorant receptor n=1 Tax=Clunio marinus TaxID=568069 RepID=A0A1J1IW53_9DIPT|nr:CLUMA_CG016002, isoform A [Clunio marinus]
MDKNLYKPLAFCFEVLKRFGLWQDGKQTWSYFFLGYLFHLVFIELILCFQIVYLTKTTDVMDFIESFSHITALFAAMMKSFIFIWKLKSIKKSVDSLNEMISNSRFSNNDHMKREVLIVFRIFKIFWMLFACSSLTGFVPIFHNQLPFKMWFPFETVKEKSQIGYWIATIYLQILAFALGSIVVSLDTLPVFLMSFATGFLKQLSERIMKIEKYDDLIECVNNHRFVKNFIKEIEDNFASAIFFQGLISSLTLCTGVFIMSFTESARDFTAITVFLIPITLEIFLPCYFGNKLSVASSALTTSIFHSEWIEKDRKLKKAAMIFMECSQKHLKITSLGTFDVNIATFSSILKSAYSFFNVMKQEILKWHRLLTHNH